jgi:branched-chain amino acid transport system substrate-binding protein
MSRFMHKGYAVTAAASKIQQSAMVLVAGLGLLGAVSCASAETLKIGVIAPMTGPAAQWGMATAGGVSILASEINAKGGLEVGGKKYQLEVVARDDQYKAGEAIAAYNRLVRQDGVKYVFVMSSPSTQVLKQSVEDDGVVTLTSSLTEKAFDQKTRYMFRLYSPPTHFLVPLIGWMQSNLKERRIAIMNPNDETGWGLGEGARKVYQKDGFQVLGLELYERSTKDFQPVLTKVLATKPEIIDVGASSPATAGLIIRQARELGYRGRFVQTGAGGAKEIIAGAGKEAAEGTITTLYADQANPGYQRIVAAYKKTNGQDPNNIVVAFYDAANVLVHAIQSAGDVNATAKVAAAFPRALPMKSVQGDMLTLGGKDEIGSDRQIMNVMNVSIVKNGQPEIVAKIK